jgi:hypothetical protein
MTTYDPGRPGRVAVPEQRRSEPASAPSRWDRARWGPIWAGAVVAVPVFLVLQSLFFALGWLNLGFEGGGGATAASIVSGILALIAFFVGGLMAGATAMWGGAEDGVLHGILMWALTVLGILTLALLGAGIALGPLANMVTDVSAAQQRLLADPNFDTAAALQQARVPAGWGALALGLSAAAAALGGVLGSRLWPRQRTEQSQPSNRQGAREAPAR